MLEWKKYRLEELVDATRGISYGVVQPGAFQKDTGVPILKVNNLTEGKFSIKDADRIDESIEKKYSRTRLQGNEVLVSVVGSLGHVFRVTHKQIGWNVVRALAVLPIKENFNRDWIYYSLKSPGIQNEFVQRAMHTVQATLNLKELREIVIPIPDLPTQTAIAEILSSLDDKIELNNQINQNLEALAQLLFKRWFVDFEFPDENGQPYRSSGGKMVESERGKIPSGWKFKSLYDCAEYINGAAYKDMYFSEEEDALPVVKIAELKNGISQSTKYTKTNLGDKYLLKTGDILFSWSGSPETSIDIFLWSNGAAWLNQHIFKVVTTSVEIRTFVYCMLRYQKPKFIATAKNKQTTGLGHVTVKDLKEMDIPFPDMNTLKLFSSTVSDSIDLIQNNLSENRSLSVLRNNLLPKLINGEIEINPTRKVLEDA